MECAEGRPCRCLGRLRGGELALDDVTLCDERTLALGERRGLASGPRHPVVREPGGRVGAGASVLGGTTCRILLGESSRQAVAPVAQVRGARFPGRDRGQVGVGRLAVH